MSFLRLLHLLGFLLTIYCLSYLLVLHCSMLHCWMLLIGLVQWAAAAATTTIYQDTKSFAHCQSSCRSTCDNTGPERHPVLVSESDYCLNHHSSTMTNCIVLVVIRNIFKFGMKERGKDSYQFLITKYLQLRKAKSSYWPSVVKSYLCSVLILWNKFELVLTKLCSLTQFPTNQKIWSSCSENCMLTSAPFFYEFNFYIMNLYYFSLTLVTKRCNVASDYTSNYCIALCHVHLHMKIWCFFAFVKLFMIFLCKFLNTGNYLCDMHHCNLAGRHNLLSYQFRRCTSLLRAGGPCRNVR